MKRNVIAFALLASFAAGSVQAAQMGQSIATWSATAKKDTTSTLVVTPLGSLTFQYADGVKGFNTQKGLFDVAIEGDATATAFKLSSRLISNTLTQLDGSGSTLNVAVHYMGEEVKQNADTVMVDTTSNKNGGLSILATDFSKTGRVTAQDAFTFSIANGTTDGTTAATDMSQLPEGIWSGDISVQFDATWS